ncbi:MAG TPA: ester cyclase [Acidimicrobiia bacterium]|nr:ester cyclase [Acidimicrobiia bacterium]
MSDAASTHQQMIEMIRQHDLSGLRGLYHPDYVYTGSDGAEHKGPDAGVEVAELYTTAFPDLDLDVRAVWAPTDDVSIIEFVARGTHTGPLEDVAPTNRRVDVHVCNVIEVSDDGRILSEREYFDELALLRQLGVIDT